MDDVKTGAGFKGVYEFKHMRDGVCIDAWREENLIPLEGLNFILNVLVNAATAKINTWYVGLGTGAYTAASTDTGANIVGVSRANETSLYAESARQAVTMPATSTGVVTNSAAKALITATADVTITNAFIVSTSPKADATGTLLSSLKLTVPKTLAAAEQLEITFSLTASSV